MCEQATEASQAGEANLEAGFGDVMAPLRQKRLRPLYAQTRQELVRRLPVGLLVDAQEVVGGEVCVGRDVRQRDRTHVGVAHELPGLDEAPVRLRVHAVRVPDVVPEPMALLERSSCDEASLSGVFRSHIIHPMTTIEWEQAAEFEDIRYEKAEG